MIIQLPIEILYIIHQLKKNGFNAYLVGGAVRDIIINSTKSQKISVVDYDFTTNAIPEQIQAIFPENFYENDYGTVSITQEHLREQILNEGFLVNFIKNKTDIKTNSTRIIDLKTATKIHHSLQNNDHQSESIEPPAQKNQNKPYEITTYRSDGDYDDFRRPNNVSWGRSIEEDLQRRDFTINAIALSINDNYLSNLFSSVKNELPTMVSIYDDNYQIIDPHQGIIAINEGIIRTVGNPITRFSEDALRPLRAIRFAMQLNMEIEEETWQAIISTASLIKNISQERIRDEFLKMLITPNPSRAIKMLFKTGLLEEIIPELIMGRGVEQAGHHITDVWTHSLDALDSCPSSDPIVKLATLIHDIGKPLTYRKIDNKITFYNHEIIGSRIASKIGNRLKLSKKDIQRLFILVRYHMFYYQPEHSDASIRRFMRNVGLENVDDILDLREGDRLGSGARKTSWRLEEMKQRMIEQLHQPMEVRDLAINGHDLMKEFSIPAGRQLGEILNYLFEEVIENSALNEKDALLKLARSKFFSNIS